MITALKWIGGIAIILTLGYTLDIMDISMWEYWVFVVGSSIFLGIYTGAEIANNIL